MSLKKHIEIIYLTLNQFFGFLKFTSFWLSSLFSFPQISQEPNILKKPKTWGFRNLRNKDLGNPELGRFQPDSKQAYQSLNKDWSTRTWSCLPHSGLNLAKIGGLPWFKYWDWMRMFMKKYPKEIKKECFDNSKKDGFVLRKSTKLRIPQIIQSLHSTFPEPEI